MSGPGRLSYAALAMVGLLLSERFLNDRVLVQPQVKHGHVLVDAHAHPLITASIDELAERFSHGAVGLAEKNTSKNTLSYDLALKLLPNVQEIDKGLFAEFEYQGRRGYFFRVQEIESDFHVLAIGVGKRLPTFMRAEDAIDAVHANGGITVLNHPYIVLLKGAATPTLLTGDFEDYTEERRFRIAKQAVEVEEFNAHAINALPGVYDLSEANRRATILRQKLQSQGVQHKGIAVSDSHYLVNPILRVGISVPEKDINMKRLMQYITDGQFEVYPQYARRIDVAAGHLEGLFRRLLR